MFDTNLFTCIQCGNSFYLTDKEMEWYADRGLHMPRRCPLCREQNRLSGRTIPKPIPTPAPDPIPVSVPEPPAPSRIFFAHLVNPNRTKVHGNAKFHIFDEHGKSKCYCNTAEEQSLYADVTLIQPDVSEMCVACMKKTTLPPQRVRGRTHTHSTK